jgi:hypothetical protein
MFGRCWPGGIDPSMRRNTLRTAVEYAIAAEERAPRRGGGILPGISSWIESRVENVEPTRPGPISNDGDDQKVACACRGHIHHPHRFRAVSSEFVLGSFQKFCRRAAAQRLTNTKGNLRLFATQRHYPRLNKKYCR